MTKMVEVVVVDDHPLIREAVRSLLAGREDIEVVGEGGVGDDALLLMEAHEPDILLLDLNMPQRKVDNNGAKFYAPPVIEEINNGASRDLPRKEVERLTSERSSSGKQQCVKR